MAQVITQSDFITGKKPMPIAQGSEVISIRTSLTFPAARSINDLLSFFYLPVDHVPEDFMVDSDDGDSGTSMTISVGLLTSAGTDLSTAAADGGAVWLSASTVSQAGGLVRPTTVAVTRVTPSATTARTVAVKLIAAGSATAVVIGLTFRYRAAYYSG